MSIDLPHRSTVAVLVIALVGLGACQPASDDDWGAVQAYVDVDTQWHTEMDRIARSDESGEAKQAAREALGGHPDIAAAVAAARRIVADPGHALVAEAAEFLVDHPFGLSPTAEEDIALGVETLARIIGADWSVVDRYEQAVEAWRSEYEEISAAELEPDERTARLEALGRRPMVARAVGAALAVLDAEQGDAVRAAEFLINDTMVMGGREQFVLRGARTLAAKAPDYDNWPETLRALDAGRFRANGQIDAFFEELAARTTDPVARATARYYLAAGLARTSTAPAASESDDVRERALAAAVGLSRGVEEETFGAPLRAGDDETAYGTFADAEASLVYRIEHATVGGTLPELAGMTIDGSEENLSDYAGKVVLIDFWATWCGPCVAALPQLRELVEEQPADRFALLAISVDETLEEVIDFQADEPMPWPNWYVGEGSELARTWDVRAYPTYMLANEDGVILARTSSLDAILSAVADATGATGV